VVRAVVVARHTAVAAAVLAGAAITGLALAGGVAVGLAAGLAAARDVVVVLVAVVGFAGFAAAVALAAAVRADGALVDLAGLVSVTVSAGDFGFVAFATRGRVVFFRPSGAVSAGCSPAGLASAAAT
jgi:hypothetical protein